MGQDAISSVMNSGKTAIEATFKISTIGDNFKQAADAFKNVFNSIFGNQVAQLGDTKSTSASDAKNDKTETMKMAKELIGEIKNLIKEFRAAKENNGPEAADKKTSEQAQSKIEQKMEQLLEKLDKLLEKLLKSDEESSSNKTGNNLIARAQKTVERTEQMLDFYQLPAPNRGT